MDELEKLYDIPPSQSPTVYIRYYSAIKNHFSKKDPNFNLQLFDKKFNDFMDNYWLKYHQDDEVNLRIILANIAQCEITDLPAELIMKTTKRLTFGDGFFHGRIRNELPQFEYYYSVIFNPYYQKIKAALLDIEPLFGALEESFLKAMIVNHLDGHQDNYFFLKKKYKAGLPSFYERVIYYGFNVLYQNDKYLHANVDNNAHRVVLSQIFMNYKKQAA